MGGAPLKDASASLGVTNRGKVVLLPVESIGQRLEGVIAKTSIPGCVVHFVNDLGANLHHFIRRDSVIERVFTALI